MPSFDCPLFPVTGGKPRALHLKEWIILPVEAGRAATGWEVLILSVEVGMGICAACPLPVRT